MKDLLLLQDVRKANEWVCNRNLSSVLQRNLPVLQVVKCDLEPLSRRACVELGAVVGVTCQSVTIQLYVDGDEMPCTAYVLILGWLFLLRCFDRHRRVYALSFPHIGFSAVICSFLCDIPKFL